VLKAEEKRRTALQANSRVVSYEATLLDGTWPLEGFQRFENKLLAPLLQKSKRGEALIPLESRLTRLEALDSNRIRLCLIQGKNGNIRVRDLLMHVFDLSAERVQEACILKISSEPMEG
jgi:hypothetical protein